MAKKIVSIIRSPDDLVTPHEEDNWQDEVAEYGLYEIPKGQRQR